MAARADYLIVGRLLKRLAGLQSAQIQTAINAARVNRPEREAHLLTALIHAAVLARLVGATPRFRVAELAIPPAISNRGSARLRAQRGHPTPAFGR